ncbi:hypothetical protein [Kineococcus terrestris]|uniref:hypothetical protein n=1 Tax=Kineococcus terrestris TaxID=2044856 RepID=UPI0034DB25E0
MGSGAGGAAAPRVEPTAARSRAWMTSRRVLVLLLVVFVVLGGTGLLGVRDAVARASGDGCSLEVRYPRVARAGLDVPLRYSVSCDRPLPAQVVLGVSQDYATMFEAQGFAPEPESQSGDGSTTWFTVAVEPGSRDLVLDVDTYVQPSSQRGREAEVVLRLEDREVARTSFRTTLLP